jgi:hypothetical protein
MSAVLQSLATRAKTTSGTSPDGGRVARYRSILVLVLAALGMGLLPYSG